MLQFLQVSVTLLSSDSKIAFPEKIETSVFFYELALNDRYRLLSITTLYEQSILYYCWENIKCVHNLASYMKVALNSCS